MNLLTTSFLVGLLLQSQAMLLLSGVDSPEELDSQTIEHLEELRSHPLDLNSAGKSKLVSSGLFTPYQAASILDYRERSGDILSFSELALVDGIGEELAGALKEFVTLESRFAPGQRSRKRFEGSASGRYSGSGYMVKGRFAYGQKAELALSVKSPAEATGSAAWYGRRWLGKVVAGNFNTRFGQGLVMWSGMTQSGFSSCGSFRKKASGLSSSTTTSTESTLHGVGADFNFGNWTVCGMLGMELGDNSLSLIPAFNAGWTGRRSQFSLSAIAGPDQAVAGADWGVNFGKLDFYGEAAWDFYGKGPAAVAGLNWNIGWQCGVNLLGRYYSPAFGGKWSAAARSASKTSDEAGVALGGRWRWLEMTADAAWHPSKQSFQSKVKLNASPSFKVGPCEMAFTGKAALRYRSADEAAWRTELRAEAECGCGPWAVRLRADAAWCKSFAWLWYAEAGRKSDIWFVWLRGGLFCVDNWDDRIYVYERDVPGSYNVPAYYGRGWDASLVAGLKLGGFPKVRHRLNTRLATTQYPWTPDKSPKYEWKIQYTVDW